MLDKIFDFNLLLHLNPSPLLLCLFYKFVHGVCGFQDADVVDCKDIFNVNIHLYSSIDSCETLVDHLKVTLWQLVNWFILKLGKLEPVFGFFAINFKQITLINVFFIDNRLMSSAVSVKIEVFRYLPSADVPTHPDLFRCKCEFSFLWFEVRAIDAILDILFVLFWIVFVPDLARKEHT